MAIAINVGVAYDIETYDGLVAFVTDHLQLDAETVIQLPTLIRKAEARLDRLCMFAERETSETVSTVADTQTVSLPTDFRHLRGVRLLADNGYPLAPVTYNVLHGSFSDNSGKPQVYAVVGGVLHLGPVPDAAYSLQIDYTASFANLSDANQTNWLLSENPDAYVCATIYETLKWLEDLDAAALYRAELFSIIDEINLQANRFRNSTPIRLRSPVVV